MNRNIFKFVWSTNADVDPCNGGVGATNSKMRSLYWEIESKYSFYGNLTETDRTSLKPKKMFPLWRSLQNYIVFFDIPKGTLVVYSRFGTPILPDEWTGEPKGALGRPTRFPRSFSDVILIHIKLHYCYDQIWGKARSRNLRVISSFLKNILILWDCLQS